MKYDLPQSIEYFKEEKDKADILYKTNDYSNALLAYLKVLEDIKTFCSHKLSKEEDLKEIIYKIGVPINLNVCRCYFKQNEYNNVITFSNKILDLDNMNYKAKYLRCLSALKINDIELADKDYDYLLKNANEGVNIDYLITQYNNIVQENYSRRKKLFKKMINTESEYEMLNRNVYTFSIMGIIKYYLQGVKEALLFPIKYYFN